MNRLGEHMMTSLEASKYLGVTEQALLYLGTQWGLNQWDESKDGRGILFFPEEIYKFKIKGLKHRPLITASELARAVDL